MKRDVLLGTLIFAAILGFGLYMFLFDPAVEVSYRPVDIEGAELIIPNQIGTRDVEVVRVNLPVPGFVSIHESLSGAPAAPVGSSPLLEGLHENVIFDLEGELNLQLGNVALLLADDGDGIYEPGVDLPISVDGEVIRIRFEASPE